MGIIISIANNKGGCGKTTTTVNLADAIGKKGKKVLVVDMDSQCNTTSRLIKNTSIRNSVYDVLNQKEPLQDIHNFTYPTECKNVSIMPNIEITGNLEPALIFDAPDSFFRLRKTLRDYAAKNFDVTLIDNPPNMGTFVLCSLYASDFVIVPVKAGSIDSVEGLIRATQLIEDVQTQGDKTNSDLRFLRILINCVDKRTAISKAIVEKIQQTFDHNQVFKTEIPVNTTFERSESARKTVFQEDGTSAGARAFRKLAGELFSILEGSSDGKASKQAWLMLLFFDQLKTI